MGPVSYTHLDVYKRQVQRPEKSKTDGKTCGRAYGNTGKPHGLMGRDRDPCLLYTSVTQAIDKFIPDVYRHSRAIPGRYDYIPADSAAGVVVYDDLFVYLSLIHIFFETVSCSYITQKDKNTRQIMKLEWLFSLLYQDKSVRNY